jgi:hypothetical protein
MAKENTMNSVYIVVETWDNKGDCSIIPIITVFRTLKSARQFLRRLIKEDKIDGISSHIGTDDVVLNVDDGTGDWCVIKKPNRYYAAGTNGDRWVNIQIYRKHVRQ